MWGFMMDSNFQAKHMRMRNPENDVPLSDGAGFMVSRKPYKLHLKLAIERQQISFKSHISAAIRSCSARNQHAIITAQLMM